MEANIKWNTLLSFTGESKGHYFPIDTVLANGSLNRGPNPKEYVLNAIGTCSGMDVISILRKKKNEPLTFDIQVTSDTTKTTPAYFDKVLIKFKVMGEVDPDILIKACHDSMTKYCGVSYMISKACPIFYEVYLNEKNIASGESKFDL